MNNLNIIVLLLYIFLNIIVVKSYTTHYNIKTILHYVDDSTKFLFFDRVNKTAWDKNWNSKIGVVSLDQCPHIKSILLPKENTFYCALPYNDLDIYGRKANAFSIPWARYDDPEQKSILKNRWIKVIHKDAFVFCQYEDVGPEFEDDFSYVFGASHSVPESGYGGLAISPEVADFLGIKDKFKPIRRETTSYDTSPISFPIEEQTKTPAAPKSLPPQQNGSGSLDDSSSSTLSSSSSTLNTSSNDSLNDQNTELTSNVPIATIAKPSKYSSVNYENDGGNDDYSPFSSSSVIPITSFENDIFNSDNEDIRCSWQFVDDKDVPEGPWKKIITSSPSDEVFKNFQN